MQGTHLTVQASATPLRGAAANTDGHISQDGAGHNVLAQRMVLGDKVTRTPKHTLA